MFSIDSSQTLISQVPPEGGVLLLPFCLSSGAMMLIRNASCTRAIPAV
jgi:hypothetical protein